MDFLDEGAAYRARIFRDGEGADYLTDPYPVTIEEIDVVSTSVIGLVLAKSGGTAIVLTRK